LRKKNNTEEKGGGTVGPPTARRGGEGEGPKVSQKCVTDSIDTREKKHKKKRRREINHLRRNKRCGEVKMGGEIFRDPPVAKKESQGVVGGKLGKIIGKKFHPQF